MLTFTTTTPKELLASIKAAIDNHRVETWEYDSDGDFTHKPDQWRKKAWLRPVIANNALNFGILAPKNETVSKELYAIYHGRFSEMMLAHFDNSFSYGSASAQLQPPDISN